MCFFFKAEDGIRDLVRSRGLGDVYKRQLDAIRDLILPRYRLADYDNPKAHHSPADTKNLDDCLLYTSDAADERSSVDLGGRRIIKKKKKA
mgnify:CR=1 FL=1